MIRAKKRLDHEYESFPLDYIKVNFKNETFLEWHFLFIGQNGTLFEGGEYHGTLVFPENYPFSPPSIRFITPNGRFQTDERICFSISDFHPENWKPEYTMSSFLQGVYSFMMTETTDTVGSLEKDESEVRELAGKSKEFNFQDGSAELFQNETKAALTENSDTDPIPSPINNLDIPSSPPFVLSKQAKPNNTTVTVGNLGMNTNSKMGLASKSRESTKKVAALIDFFQSQSENVNSPSSENTKLTTRFKSIQSHEITQPSKSTESADQLILPHPVIGKVINSTVSSDSTSNPSQRSGYNGFHDSKEKQEDNVTSSSEPPEDSKHLPTDTVRILDMDEEEIKKLPRMGKEFNEHDEAYNKMIDETIQSSLNNFSANVKSEHICTSANGTHDNYNIIATLSSHSTANLNSHWLNRAKKRLLSEFKEISDNPSDNILIEFTEDKFLEWYFLFKGLKETLFEGGEYHGMLEFPENYPFYPPSVQFFTPNGRFKTNERVRFILSDFCPKCSNPSYTVSAVLQVAYAFMMSETTGTVGSLILDKNEIRNLARMSKEFNRNNDTFNELFEEKVDEDIDYPLDNSDDLIRKKNIERPSDLIPIAVPNTTRLTESISTHKTNERPPSHLAKVDNEEHAIGQNSSFTANTSRNSFNCPSNSDEGKESHTSKLLDKTLPEESKSTHGHNSATHVSQYPERPKNVSVRSPDYVINNARDNCNRDTSDIPKPNKEVSSERSNDSLRQNASSNRSMDSSKKSTTDKYSANPPKRSENAQMPKTGHKPNSLAQDQSGITSVASDSSKEFSLRKSQPNLSYTTDKYSSNLLKGSPNSSTAHQSSSMGDISPSYSPTSAQDSLSQNTIEDDKSTHLSGRSEIVSISKKDHTLNSFTCKKDGIPSIVTTETVGSLKMDRNGIRNLARKSKDSDRDNDTFNELFGEKIDEDINYYLNNSDGANRKWNIERPSHLNQIPVPDTTEPTQSISTHKANERPSHLAKVLLLHKDEQAIRQTSFLQGNASLNTFNCPSSSVIGKESHTSNLLERTLLERSKSTHSNNTATWVSQCPEKADNVSMRSSDYVIDNAPDNYNRDIHDISKPNKEFSSEKSRGRLSKKASGNRSMNSSSFHSRTSLDKNTLPQTTGYDRSTHLSEESKNVSAHKANHTPNPLTDRENQILQDSNAHIDKDSARSRVMDLNISNLPPSDYPSEPLHSQVQPKVSREKLFTMNSNITDSNDLFKEKVDETIKCPLNNFPTEHKKRQSTIIGPDSHLKQSEIIASSSGELGAHERLSTDSILSHPNNEKNIDSLNSNRVAVQDRSEGAQLYSIHKAKEQPPQHYKMPPLENAKHVQANLERRVQTISEKAKLSIKPLLNNISKTLINTVNASELNAETPAKNPFVNISDHSSKDIAEKQSKTSESLTRTSLVTSQRNQNTITDERVIHQPHPSGKFKDDSMRNKYRSPKYLVDNQSGIIFTASDSTIKFPPQISRLNENNTADNWVVHPTGKFENVPRPKFDRAPKSLVDNNPHSNYSSKVLSSLPSTIIQEVHYENPIIIQTFTTSSDKIVPRNTNSKLQDSDISNPIQNKAPENTSVKKASEFPRSYPLNSSVKSKSSQNLTVISTNNRPPSHPLNSSVKSKSSQNLTVISTNNRPPSHPLNSSNRNRPSQRTRYDKSITKSPSLPFLNRSQDHRNTNRLYLPPEKIGGKSRSKSDQAPLSFADNRSRIIFDASNEFSSQKPRPNQINALYKQVANPSGRSENGSASNCDRVPNYLADKNGRIITIQSDYLEDISSQISHLHPSKTIDKRMADPPRESEKSPVCNFDQVHHSYYDKKNDSTSDTSKQLECIPDVVVGSTSDKNLDQFYPLTEISNARPEKDSTLSGEKNPFRSNTLHSDSPRKVLHYTLSKVLPEVQYNDPSPIKANNTSSGTIHRAVPLNHAFHSFDISDYSINNKSTQNLSVRSFIKSPPTNPSDSSIKGKSPGNVSGKKTNKPPNSSIKNRPSVDSNTKRTIEGTPSHPRNSSNTNNSSVNPSTIRTIKATPFYLPNSSDKIEAFHNTNGNKSITSLNRSQFQGHGRSKTYSLLPDGSSLISANNNSSDLKHTGPIKSDLIPSSATFRSHSDKFKQLSKPASLSKSTDRNVRGSKHTRSIGNSHQFSFSANNHNHDDILNQPAKSNNRSFSREKVECPKSFNSNPLPKEKSGRVMDSSNYATSSSNKDGDCNKINRGAHMNPISNTYLFSHIKSLQRYETHLSLREAKSHFNFLLSHNAQSMEQLSSHGSGSDN